MTGLILTILMLSNSTPTYEFKETTLIYGEYKHNISSAYPLLQLRKIAKYRMLRMAIKVAWNKYCKPLLQSVPSSKRRYIKNKIYRNLNRYLSGYKDKEERILYKTLYFTKANLMINIVKLQGDVKHLLYYSTKKSITLYFENPLAVRLKTDIVRFFNKPDWYIKLKYSYKKKRKKHHHRRKQLCKTDFCLKINIIQTKTTDLLLSKKQKNNITKSNRTFSKPHNKSSISEQNQLITQKAKFQINYEFYTKKQKLYKNGIKYYVKADTINSLAIKLPEKLNSYFKFFSTTNIILHISGISTPVQLFKLIKILKNQEKSIVSINSYILNGKKLTIKLNVISNFSKPYFLKNLFLGDNLTYTSTINQNIIDLQIKKIPLSFEETPSNL